MFKVGEIYRITMIEGDLWSEYPSCEILDVNNTLIKIRGMSFPNEGQPIIINTASSSFISAEKVDTDTMA
ncbi:hypothetical protein FHP25_33955 [Vineibacter terrae]|uniref:Uncharacterized protein n=1 Tax=Vineibacter terrae TaxID=2586908 RepID=A0A5C8PAZ4_9HYPH|nr:hypothetical protein [Vineibacter terrae]TXL70542.1 hypothetical protein FHP25_33955 [Vineibacter terrae]